MPVHVTASNPRIELHPNTTTKPSMKYQHTSKGGSTTTKSLPPANRGGRRKRGVLHPLWVPASQHLMSLLSKANEEDEETFVEAINSGRLTLKVLVKRTMELKGLAAADAIDDLTDIAGHLAATGFDKWSEFYDMCQDEAFLKEAGKDHAEYRESIQPLLSLLSSWTKQQDKTRDRHMEEVDKVAKLWPESQALRLLLRDMRYGSSTWRELRLWAGVTSCKMDRTPSIGDAVLMACRFAFNRLLKNKSTTYPKFKALISRADFRDGRVYWVQNFPKCMVALTDEELTIVSARYGSNYLLEHSASAALEPGNRNHAMFTEVETAIERAHGLMSWRPAAFECIEQWQSGRWDNGRHEEMDRPRDDSSVIYSDATLLKMMENLRADQANDVIEYWLHDNTPTVMRLGYLTAGKNALQVLASKGEDAFNGYRGVAEWLQGETTAFLHGGHIRITETPASWPGGSIQPDLDHAGYIDRFRALQYDLEIMLRVAVPSSMPSTSQGGRVSIPTRPQIKPGATKGVSPVHAPSAVRSRITGIKTQAANVVREKDSRRTRGQGKKHGDKENMRQGEEDSDQVESDKDADGEVAQSLSRHHEPSLSVPRPASQPVPTRSAGTSPKKAMSSELRSSLKRPATKDVRVDMPPSDIKRRKIANNETSSHSSIMEAVHTSSSTHLQRGADIVESQGDEAGGKEKELCMVKLQQTTVAKQAELSKLMACVDIVRGQLTELEDLKQQAGSLSGMTPSLIVMINARMDDIGSHSTLASLAIGMDNSAVMAHIQSGHPETQSAASQSLQPCISHTADAPFAVQTARPNDGQAGRSGDTDTQSIASHSVRPTVDSGSSACLITDAVPPDGVPTKVGTVSGSTQIESSVLGHDANTLFNVNANDQQAEWKRKRAEKKKEVEDAKDYDRACKEQYRLRCMTEAENEAKEQAMLQAEIKLCEELREMVQPSVAPIELSLYYLRAMTKV